MADQAGDKTQDPTPHRRQKAYEEGQVAKSHDMASAALLVIGLSTLLLVGNGLVDYIRTYTESHLSAGLHLSADREYVMTEWNATLAGLARHVLPLLGLLFLGAVVVEMGQVGVMFLPDRAMPDLSRVNPLQGLQRLFSLPNVVRLVFGLIKMVVVASVAWTVAMNEWEQILGLGKVDVPVFAAYLAQLLVWTGLKIGIALLILSILDYGFQRWKHEQDLKMTSQEVREEMKNLEGDPQMISRRRQVQRQLVMNRLSSAVPKADVVVTNPTELAIAIQYDPKTMAAPIVVAKGAGMIAQRIRQLALENGIPIVEKKPLAQALYREVDVNHPIPSDKYGAVAEILAYVYRLKGKPIPGGKVA
jgi:flagellar biosynthetic protein FlhB